MTSLSWEDAKGLSQFFSFETASLFDIFYNG